MSEHIHEQTSEFVDDEMSVEECDFFVRRLQRDGDARKRFLRYQLIGAVLRGEQPHPRQESGEINRAVSSPVLARAGIAASVVLAAMVGLVSGDSTILPQRLSENVQHIGAQSDFTGIQYLIHHMGTSTGLSRTLMHSSVFSALEFDTDDDEDEGQAID
jgi:negative regulator of sigma E activity